jgi:hypothetical protein
MKDYVSLENNFTPSSGKNGHLSGGKRCDAPTGFNE